MPTAVLATVTGRDRPGVTAAFFAALAAHDVDVRDVEQVVIRDRMVLAVLLELQGEVSALRSSVVSAAHALGMECEVAAAQDSRAARRSAGRARSHVIVLGHPLRPGALSSVTQRIADLGGNIESITQLSTEPVSAVELLVSTGDEAELRAALVQAAEDTGVDIAVEPAGLRRRAKRLVVLDVDSTLIQDEGIDVLATRAGVGEQVAHVTARAMAGELDFTESLVRRVELLAGLPVSDVYAARDTLRLTPGARTFVHTLRRLGFHVGVVSGGFTVFTDRFVAELELDFAAANELEVADGRLTGRLVGEVVDRAGKAKALTRFAEQFGVPLSQTVAVGDGANDIDMLDAAGLGIAFNAKAALRAAADTSVNVPYLDSVLFVLGISRDEIVEAGG
ncbi:phosphoserine phosphatase SerB [Jatrophihabitans cynanchi]|jgi:phosphoserine phosphatase|uniref:phosphoserine phosphatase n=1 Tax=Jatrophihabitans cynanchi TaxID=2944128 RepID=A0ABY7K3J3_9ACTN|nr:phosphoserine phosphatase SerB [Jatrophihabitans sp. SB3-54]WAX58192.1 phosphoserine phosphatase SerB [Jatrophihabitans sp. SB3-54]